MLNIIDNFIKPHIQDSLENLCLSNSFPYYYNKETINLDTSNNYFVDDNSLEGPQFVHIFISDGQIFSEYYKNVSPISNKLIDVIDTPCHILRCKLNMNFIDSRFGDKYHTPHIDNPQENQITAIYYVNDSDGDTYFFDDTGKITEKLTPKKGRLIWWKGRIFHAKSSPTKSINRLVINFNLLPIKEIK